MHIPSAGKEKMIPELLLISNITNVLVFNTNKKSIFPFIVCAVPLQGKRLSLIQLTLVGVLLIKSTYFTYGKNKYSYKRFI